MNKHNKDVPPIPEDWMVGFVAGARSRDPDLDDKALCLSAIGYWTRMHREGQHSADYRLFYDSQEPEKPPKTS